MNGLLKINVNERLSWEDYFNHPFFKQELSFNYPIFNFKCKIHFQNLNSYCQNCKLNICEYCLNEHNNHKIIPFNKIGLNDEELNQFDILFKGIEKNINSFNQLKNDIQSFLIETKLIKENKSIYENDEKNNYKKYYIDILKKVNAQLENKLNINFINLKRDNYIICEYNIKKDKINQQIQILNSYEEIKRKHYNDWNWRNIKVIENEKEIEENCEIYLNNKRKDFCYELEFEKIDKNEIKIVSKTPLKSTNWMFSYCSSLTSLDLSNFNTNNVTNMGSMFYNCSSLISLNLSNFNTNNVTNMGGMFSDCSSLTYLDLSNFNTNNVKEMWAIFSGLNKKKCKLICEDAKILKEFS